MQNLILNLPIPKLLLPVNLLRMRPDKRRSLRPNILTLQLIDQLKMVMFPLIIVTKHINEQSQDLGHQIPQDDGDGDEDEDHEDAFYWIFGGDVPVGDGCDNCDAEVHDVGVHLRPGQDERHVVEGPAVVDPAQVGSVGTVVVVAVDPVADQVEGYAHVVSVDNEDNCQFDAQSWVTRQNYTLMRLTVQNFTSQTSLIQLESARSTSRGMMTASHADTSMNTSKSKQLRRMTEISVTSNPSLQCAFIGEMSISSNSISTKSTCTPRMLFISARQNQSPNPIRNPISKIKKITITMIIASQISSKMFQGRITIPS